MKIIDLFKNKKTVVSLEVFPPKIDAPIESVYKTIDELKDLKPDFISVTYGALGNIKGRTVEIASKIKKEYGIESLAHLTCIAATKEEMNKTFMELKENGIENVLALRGDLPADPDFKFPDPLHFKYARDLIKEIKEKTDFSIAAACYPEGHVTCTSKVDDIKFLKEKVDMGAEYLITQLFYDNELFYEFMEKTAIANINVPISCGILPVLNKNQVMRITQLSGCKLPPKFLRILDRYENNPEALKEAGEAYAIEQIIDLMAFGVSGIHLYTMNKPDTARRIINNIENIRKI
jgi:methylenetetrahydrofolate reductase (NADPH)